MKDLIYKNIKHGLYEIDEFGNVYSKYKNGFLKPKRDKDGYLLLTLSGGKRGNSCFTRVATLVIVTYVGLPEKHIKDPTVNHIDGNKLNNHYSNLEWIGRSKNSSIRENKGVGSKNPAAILNETDVEKICELLLKKELSMYEISLMFGVTKSAINNIKRCKVWKEITSKYFGSTGEVWEWPTN